MHLAALVALYDGTRGHYAESLAQLKDVLAVEGGLLGADDAGACECVAKLRAEPGRREQRRKHWLVPGSVAAI